MPALVLVPRRSVAACVLVLSMGCAGGAPNEPDTSSASPEEPAPKQESDTDDELRNDAGPAVPTQSMTAPTSHDVEFVIPIEPVDEGGLSFLVAEDEATGQAAPQGEHVLRLAFGEGYPDVLRLTVASVWLPVDSTVLSPSELTVESATSDDDGLEVRILEGALLELHVRRVGTYTLQLEVTAEFEQGATRTFVASVSVRAIQVAGAEWSTCTGPLVVVSGAPMASSRLYPLSADGTPFEPLNTAFDRGAELIVRAQAGTRIAAPAGVDSLIVTGPSQTIEIRSNYGPVASFELIQPEEVDALSPTFVSSVGGSRGGSTTLASDAELAVDLAERPYLSVFPGARFGDIHLCGGPAPALFELRSTTPGVCTIQTDGCSVRGCLTAGYVPSIANIVAAGVCTLELEAPTLAHGNGLSASFSATFQTL